MRRFALILLALIALVFVASPVLAQSGEGDRRIIYRATTEIDFDDVSVEGELKKPTGAYLLDKRRGNFNPLIKIRENFDDEILRSVDEVR